MADVPAGAAAGGAGAAPAATAAAPPVPELGDIRPLPPGATAYSAFAPDSMGLPPSFKLTDYSKLKG